MRKIETLVFVSLFTFAASIATQPILAAGGSAAPPAPTRPELSPEEQADQRYNRGLKLRDKAWKYEKQAEQAKDDKKRNKLLDRAQREYTSAIRQFKAAVELKNDHYKALSSLGYALRQTGQFDMALAAYDKALAIEPGYTEAIEYRGQAYMHLGRLDEAKEAYMTLLREDRAKADTLLAAMKNWAAEQDTDPEFDAWLAEKDQLAAQVSMGTTPGAAGGQNW